MPQARWHLPSADRHCAKSAQRPLVSHENLSGNGDIAGFANHAPAGERFVLRFCRPLEAPLPRFAFPKGAAQTYVPLGAKPPPVADGAD